MVVAATISFQRIRALVALVRSDAFTQELRRTLAAWGILFAVGIWMVICQQWSDMRWLRQMQHLGATAAPWPTYALLEDVVLEHLPVLERAWISDKLVGTSVFVCIVGCCVMSAGWRERLMMVRRIGWMVAVLYLLRSITISVTTVPPSIGSCTISTPQSTWHVILATPQILAGTIGQCTDKIFSGHTAILTISFLFLRRYATHWVVVAYSAVHMGLGILSVLLARYHYTVDVVIGLLMTLFVHHLYYSALEIAVRRRKMLYEHAFHIQQQQYQHQHRRDSGSYHPPFVGLPQSLDDPDPYKLTICEADSALSIEHSGAMTHRSVSLPSNSHSGRNIVRKRETSSATALSENSSSHGWHGGGGAATGGNSSPSSPLPQPPPVSHGMCLNEPGAADSFVLPHIAATTPSDLQLQFLDSDESTHEETIEMQPLHRGNQDMFILCDSVAANGCRCHRQEERHLGLIGVNRPSGSMLPEIVAWMDGLDLRYK
ncbi:hypothetical protein LPJ59_003199 [Coemansia sp. RSA 2399]|nr:hypothetical protein LPJ59_003199 [Coemansia sp. RSA 2399]KAJ1903835.1 hypothetical protein LPJ81_002848 [Coemansia sp. IMI 209127]